MENQLNFFCIQIQNIAKIVKCEELESLSIQFFIEIFELFSRSRVKWIGSLRFDSWICGFIII